MNSSFATAFTNDAAGLAGNSSDSLRNLVDQIEHAKKSVATVW